MISPQTTPALGLLERLGYAADEIHYGWLLPDGRMSVPAVVGEETGWLFLDTSRRDDLILELSRVTKWGWPYERTNEHWGQTTLSSFFALGRSRAAGSVEVRGTEADATKLNPNWGSLGAPFFRDTVLAIDPIDTAIGLTSMIDLRDRANDAVGLPLVARTRDNIPILEVLEDTKSLGGEPPRFVIDTNFARSVISLEYIDRAWPADRRRKARQAREHQRPFNLQLRVPEVAEVIRLEPYVLERAVPVRGEDTSLRIDGYLGIDFLYRWLPVLDFRQWILWLAPLSL
ncbi:MAG TPA: hypothetical protein VGJ18_03180 [Gemmatimonadaceae bacterium]|jgi:hypothetical protein